VNDNIPPYFATTLIALVIPRENATPDSFYGNPAVVRLDDARSLMGDPRLHYDATFLLTVCVAVKFWRGAVFLLSKFGRPSDAVAILRQERQANELADFLRTDPALPVADWAAIFDEFVCNEGWSQIRERDRLEFTERVLAHVKDVLSPALIRRRLERNPDLPAHQLLPEGADADDARPAIFAKVAQEIERLNAEAQPQRRAGAQVKCCACEQGMDPPFARFFCGHCFHRTCVTVGDNGRPVCAICRAAPPSDRRAPARG
jgi:hypothetical protein